jgi:UDP-glucose 4-epimerase
LARALVTGGAGFIGSHLVGRLLEQGHEVTVLDDLSTGRTDNLYGMRGFELIEGDLRSAETVRAAVEGKDVVFHAAAVPSVARSWKDPVLSLSVNALGTATVVEEAAAAGVGALIYSSSSSIYGDQVADTKSEDLPPNPISPYGAAKLLGEKIALAHARPGALRVVGLRYFNVFGPRQDPDSPYSAVIPLFITSARRGSVATVYGDGRQTRDFTYVANVVEANLLAWQSSATGIAVNIACGRSHSLQDLINAIGDLNGRPLQVTHAEARPGDIRHSLADLTLARELLGYEPMISFEEGLRLTYAAYGSS